MYLASDSGDAVLPGTLLTAVIGPHTGRHFRFVAVHEDRARIIVHRMHPHPFRNSRAVVHPSIFALSLQAEVARARHVLNALHHAWQKLDEWLLAGVVALVPLALVDEGVREGVLHTLGSLMGGE